MRGVYRRPNLLSRNMVSAGALFNGSSFSLAGSVGATAGSGTEHVLLLLFRGLEDLESTS